jgi:hypothetical protein
MRAFLIGRHYGYFIKWSLVRQLRFPKPLLQYPQYPANQVDAQLSQNHAPTHGTLLNATAWLIGEGVSYAL